MLLVKRRSVLVAVTLIMLAAIICGCGGGLAAALRIVGVNALLPDKWTENIGVVKIVADVLSGNALKQVIAHITHSDGSKVADVVLSLNEEGKYEGSFTAEAQEPDPETLTAVVVAEDLIGNEVTSTPVEVEVPAVDQP